MPFRHRRRRRTRRNVSTAVKALRLARRAWNSSDHERKFLDGQFNALDVEPAVTAVLFFVNGIAEGVSENQRIGERVRLKTLDLRFQFDKSAANVNASTTCRFTILWDRQPNGGLATVAQVLETVTGTNNVLDMCSPYNAQNRKRFQVLKDARFTLNDGHNESRVFHWRVPLRNKTPQYNGAGAAIGNVNTGALLMMILGDITQGGNVTVLDMTTRLWYVE